ncbi:MAG: hypothetical protein AAGD25_17655 [Cyanobacteria bacterium P01_F01_bin.150]
MGWVVGAIALPKSKIQNLKLPDRLFSKTNPLTHEGGFRLCSRNFNCRGPITAIALYTSQL